MMGVWTRMAVGPGMGKMLDELVFGRDNMLEADLEAVLVNYVL
jgi:hypothetical protein